MLAEAWVRVSKSNGLGRFRVFHMSSMLLNRLMSFVNTFSNTFRGNPTDPID